MIERCRSDVVLRYPESPRTLQGPDRADRTHQVHPRWIAFGGLAEFSTLWKARFNREVVDLREAFKTALEAIHHIGSTSVPGLRAKPTIDILIEVTPGTDIPSFDPQMEALGYVCRGECLDAIVPGTPGRFYFVRKEGVVHAVHVHICEAGHFEITQMLTFREYLCSHSDEAERYGNRKSELAHEFSNDNIGYMRGKDSLVKELIVNSLRWRKAAV